VADSDSVLDTANVFVSCDAERVLETVKEGVADSVFSLDCDGVVEGGEPLRDAEEALRGHRNCCGLTAEVG
jgi:hypothetical protein